ncbi:Glycyl-tRNA synthetase beta subunit [Candidatus Johnevansia muelleri]|uniref:Glycine--tRNA ligase beta subunit n=1 Tax=Candidatus Johnevansia muelleri TaxID=1495769 RepID=A0A078KES3_9GAMM|nr:Glycyl-tRNA synthetase beta subunit [Candidatus Evansia muelleri]
MSVKITLLIELGCEELPQYDSYNLSYNLEKNIINYFNLYKIIFDKSYVYNTPRRLSIIINNIEYNILDNYIEIIGPDIKIAIKNNQLTKKGIGFIKSKNINLKNLIIINTNKGKKIGYKYIKKSVSIKNILPKIIKISIEKISINNCMRWNIYNNKFCRPIRWLVILYGYDIIRIKLFGLLSNRITYGHRIHCFSPIILNNAKEYIYKLATLGNVIVDYNHRRKIIYNLIRQQALKINANIIIDNNLLNEVTGLVEWPIALIGNFNKYYLNIPYECIISTMKLNQKYFHIFDNKNKLLPKFLTIANIKSIDYKKIISDNERVINSRLCDAFFFFNSDIKIKLDYYRLNLKDIIFHPKLGSIAEKSNRLEIISANIANLIGGIKINAIRAAQLSKCDLVTKMVYEFPELQGIMGAHYAQKYGEKNDVVIAIYNQYLPKFSNDKIPQNKTSIAIALADKIDTIIGIFSIGLQPTGTKDPFALRRYTIGILNILIKSKYNLDLKNLLNLSINQYNILNKKKILIKVINYFYDKLCYWAINHGISKKFFFAIKALNVTNIFDFVKRMYILKQFNKNKYFLILVTSIKRILNILKKNNFFYKKYKLKINNNFFINNDEYYLFKIIIRIQSEIKILINNKNYYQALYILLSLITPIYNYFNNNIIIKKNKYVKYNIFALLNNLILLFFKVADISIFD